MYTPSPIVGPTTVVTGLAVLPNTGGNPLLAVVAAVNLIIGVVLISTTVIRFLAKRAHKA